jgi:hypothetical protein
MFNASATSPTRMAKKVITRGIHTIGLSSILLPASHGLKILIT